MVPSAGMASKTGSSEMNARQRKQVYMHSTIFDNEGPAPNSVYAPSRQKELYRRFSNSLRAQNRVQPPEMDMPSAGEMKCAQNAGHNVVLGGCEIDVKPAKDETIPKEFWSTSSMLQWHDTRNEQCRAKNRAGMSAQEAKLQEMSSEVFGKPRLTEASTTARAAREELMAADHLHTDSALLQSSRPGEDLPKARTRLQQNLADSAFNTMQVNLHEPPPQLPTEDSDAERRRSERNYSDLFGSPMRERRELQREELTATHACGFLDTRSEIATRNKEHWRTDAQPAALRKDAERSSNLFDFQCPEKPAVEHDMQEVLRAERSCWDSSDGMRAALETARRGRMKDHASDFCDSEGRSHFGRKQQSLDSAQMRSGMGLEPGPREAWAAPARTSPRITASLGWSSASAEHASLRSAKDTKLASLQSSIFY